MEAYVYLRTQAGRNSSIAAVTLALLLWAICLSITPTSLRAQPAAETQQAATPAPEGSPPKPHAAEGGYYVEFRVAQIGAYGHSYAVYGNTGGRANYADLHPMGNYVVMALGHVLPVPANTQWDPDVAKLPIASRYRRNLTAAQYQNLLVAVRQARASAAPTWNALYNNCNTFIGELAKAVGLKVPGSFQVSYQFVPALRDLNENGKTSKPASARPAAKPAGGSASKPVTQSSLN
jgi:hypothetical protein